VDGGTSWTLVASSLSPVEALIRGDGDALFAGTGMLGSDIGSYPAQGVLQSGGPGTSWVPANRGLPHACTYDLAPGIGDWMFAAADQTVFWTHDAGLNWKAVEATPPILWYEDTISFDLAVHPNGDVFALSGAGLSRSRDLGASWTLLRSDVRGGHGWQQRAELEVTARGTLVVPSWSGVLRSTDGGDTWAQIQGGLPDATVEAIAVGPFGRVVACADGQTYLSEDDGLNWSAIAARTGRLAVAPDEQSIYVGRYDVVRLFQEAGGWQVQPLSALNPGEPLSDLVVDASGFVYASTREGVLRTRPGDAGWVTLSGFPDDYSFFLGFHQPLALSGDAHLWVGSSLAGVYRSTGPLTGTTDVRGLDDVFGGCSPNPFHGRTTLSFSLAQPSSVSLSVFDVRGRVVSRLLAGERLEAGSHAFEWHVPRGTSSGIYFYRLTAGDRQQTGRMLRID
jgi:photosystem II stability/assembly factor-like uncharacterized protein